MPFGSVFSRFKDVNLETADGKQTQFKNNLFSRIGIKILGIPHIGLRLRARKIMKNIGGADNLLDAGSGSGVYCFSLAKSARHIEAVDISEKNVENSREVNIFKNINFSKGDLCRLKFKNGSFDIIICSDVLEHIEDDKKAFSELSRVIKKGGYLMLTVPSDSKKNKKNYKNYGHEREGYSLKEIKRLCRENMLSVIKSEGYSSLSAEKFSDINYKMIDNKILLGLFFYPLYLAAIISDIIFKKDYNGLFLKIKKFNT